MRRRSLKTRATNIFLSSSMAEHSAVNRRVVGSSPTSGANQINQLGRTFSNAFSDTGENTGDPVSKGVLLMLSTAPRNSFNVKCP